MKSFEDQPGKEFRQRVLAAVEVELQQLRATRSWRMWWWQMAGVLGVAGVIGAVLKSRNSHFVGNEAHVDAEDLAMLTDLSLVQELDLWQNLELFENWPKGDG
jgi:hypothetical protein